MISNLAEGLLRYSINEKCKFLEIYRSSLVEIDAQLDVCLALNFCKDTDMRNINELKFRIFKMLSKMISKYRGNSKT